MNAKMNAKTNPAVQKTRRDTVSPSPCRTLKRCLHSQAIVKLGVNATSSPAARTRSVVYFETNIAINSTEKLTDLEIHFVSIMSGLLDREGKGAVIPGIIRVARSALR